MSSSGIALIAGYVVLAVLLWRHRRKVRLDQQELESAKAEAAKARAELEVIAAMAAGAVIAVIEFVTASMPDTPIREKVREMMFKTAFVDTEDFSVQLEEIPNADTALHHSVSRPGTGAVLEMPIPLDVSRSFKGQRVQDLRKRVRELRNAAIIPRHVVSGEQIGFMTKPELIRLLARYDPPEKVAA